MTEKSVRIGCSSGFWGDSLMGAAQLVRHGDIDYMVGEYLAEITMSLLVRAKMKVSSVGFVTDFIDSVKELLPEIADQGIKLITNAGGINPIACRDALLKVAEDAGVKFTVAVVEGDNLMPQLDDIKALAPQEMFSKARFPEQPISMNAYLGARPIALALDAGAQVVITGRCADSSLVLGPLMHEFKWRDEAYDLLAAGSLAGHIIECGPQGTGGIFTDWEQVKGWDNMGYPIVECVVDGSFIVTKPEGTGGLVSPSTVAEQILYEIDDPAAYILPDVVCDFTQVHLDQTGENQVRVTGVKGKPPTPYYKVSVIYADGFRAIATLMLGGFQADHKSRRVAEAIIKRTQRLFAEKGYGDYRETSVEVIGSEDTYGKNARLKSVREVVLKIGVHHESKEAVNIFSKEVVPAATSMAQGLTGLFGGRPKVTPVVRLFSFLIDKDRVPITVSLPGRILGASMPKGELLTPSRSFSGEEFSFEGNTVQVPLLALAHGRSGDKGNNANIGIIARDPAFLPLLRSQLTAEAVADYFAHILKGSVDRYELPGIHAFNFVLHEVLGGGGMASLRFDPQGKAFAQMLLDLPITVPAGWLEPNGPLANWIVLKV
ncbi:MAG: acyclic terpene utilization AtuA family protein [Candidatus Hodarchaeota archaeon]